MGRHEIMKESRCSIWRHCSRAKANEKEVFTGFVIDKAPFVRIESSIHLLAEQV
jgi:hypothetical protein